MIPFSALPHVNAALNGASAVLLLTGYAYIRAKRILVHRRFMIFSLISSSLFLVSYLVYHAHAGSARFQGVGWVRPVYFSILISHTVLAAAVLPLVLITLTFALKTRFQQHARVARWTFPIWLYVSITGVIVYLMLYH